MPNIGPFEILVVLVIALMVFGPKRLPEMGRSVGHGLREFKDSITGDKEDEEHQEIVKAATSEPTAGPVEVVRESRA